MDEERRKPYYCNICGKEFVLSVTFKAHTVLHERETPYLCSWCGKTFQKNSLALKDHMREHLEKWELCEIQQSLEKNGGPPVSEVRYVCPYCSKSLTTKLNLEKHIRSHNGEKPLSCIHCNKRYSSKESLKMHILKRHSGTALSFTCETCGDKFDSKSSLTRHCRDHNVLSVYRCDICGKEYRSKKVLQNHKKTHDDTKNHKDTHDSIALKKVGNVINVNSVNTHHEKPLKVGEREKKYTCVTCGKQLYTQRNVLNHMLMHSKDSTFCSCKVCGIAFAHPEALYSHTKLHSSNAHSSNSKNIICETLETTEKVTLYIGDESTCNIENETKHKETSMETGLLEDEAEVVGERGIQVGNRKDDVMVIDENIVIEVEEVIIDDKDT